VSVVVTCYNYGAYVAECLESVLSQTYRNIEVVVVNDGSTDDSEKEIRRLESDTRIKYVFQANSGQARAKNTGIGHSRGKYIAFLDADDRWDRRKLEKQIPLFLNPRVGVVFSRSKFIDASGADRLFAHGSGHLRPRSGNVSKHLLFDNFVPFSSAVVRRECFERAGTFDESLPMSIDWDLWLRISLDFEFAFVDEELLAYRLGHGGQMSAAVEVRYGCIERITERFLAEHGERFGRSFVRRTRLYTCANRGLYYREKDLGASTRWFLKGVKEWPFGHSAYKGLAKNALVYLSRGATR
jgi:glycosyltransferase involved in cell wall biosynthesis